VHPPKENKRLDLEKVLEQFEEIKKKRDKYETKDRTSKESLVISSRSHLIPDWKTNSLKESYLNEESYSNQLSFRFSNQVTGRISPILVSP
jgi:hypothetical protein